MKSILKKVAGLALSAALVFGMISCSSEAENNAALIGILNSSKGNSGTPVKETVATPAFSVASGAVNSGTKVTITCGTEGAKIYYTTDGTKPTAESAEYTTAISVTAAVTLKAIAVKSGMNDSAVASASYTISSGNIPKGFVKVKGTTITGNESWTPSSEVFVRGSFGGRRITIPDMYVCDHEVTRGEFKELMGTDPSKISAYDKDGNELTGDAVLNNPVNCVSWYDAIAYCNKLSLKENLTPCYSVSGVTDWENFHYVLIPTSSNSTWDALTYDKEADGYRLPTEAEWEWLARGGENYTFAGSYNLDDVAWYKTNTNDTGTREVKTKQSNGYGLYDMSGNVSEWCYDWHGTVYSSTSDTGVSFGSCRVLRGDSWYDGGFNCQVSSRNYGDPYKRYANCGFRVVRSSSKGNSGTPVMQTVATPAFSVASGAVVSGTSVTITCSTEGAKIYYTTDGSDPTAESTEYTAAISVTTAVTLKAIAVKDGMNDSAVASVSYTIYTPKYSVGDFVLKDGTILSKDATPESGTVAAVIVRADTSTKTALGVGIVHNKSGLAWCIDSAAGCSTDITELQGDETTGYMDGSDGWEKLKAACSDAENNPEYYPAWNYSLTYAKTNSLEGDLATGWYLPTVAELYTIYQNKTVVDASLSKAGGSTFGKSSYWSCCQDPSSNNDARGLFFRNGFLSYDYKGYYGDYVCSVRAFN